jgi:hypothetical protein
VRCANGSVSSLFFWKNLLNGTIPSKLGDLTKLASLDLGFNGLTGAILPELGCLTSLTFLHLSYNSLTGTILKEVGNLTLLTSLTFRDNKLSGRIPQELGSLDKLTYFDLWEGNVFIGSIPRELENLPALIDQENRFINHDNHFIDDIDEDGIDDTLDLNVGLPASVKIITTPDYSISILGSGRFLNLVSNSTF